MREKILILEDDEELREALVETLEDEDYEVYGVGSARQALRVARQVMPDLVVSDVRMAGMDGLECLAQLRQVCPKARSIVITGYASKDAPTRAIKVEAQDYLYKPFSLDDLVTAVERVLAAADEEERYSKVLGSFVAGYRKVVRAAGTAIARLELASLEKVRETLFNGFYVGVRSGQLNRSEALHIWDRLEALEREREALKTTGVHLKERGELAEGYQLLVDTVTALSREEFAFHDKRGPEQVPVRDFKEFYDRIRGGSISSQQLRLAPFLRTLDLRSLEVSAELKILHDMVWGQGEAA